VSSHAVVAVALDELHQRVDVEARRIERVDLAAVALLPVTEERRVQHRRPRHAAFEEADAQAGEAVGHAGEQQ